LAGEREWATVNPSGRSARWIGVGPRLPTVECGTGHGGVEGMLAQREREREERHGVILTTPGCCDGD
jgi:hypothetical protein